MPVKPLLLLISPYHWLSASVRIVEAVYLTQTNPEDRVSMSAIVFLVLPVANVRLTLTSANLIHVYEVIMVHVAVVVTLLVFPIIIIKILESLTKDWIREVDRKKVENLIVPRRIHRICFFQCF